MYHFEPDRDIVSSRVLCICPFIQVSVQERRMIDCCIWPKGGDGGNGCASICPGRHDRRGRPDGVFSNHFIPQGWREGNM